MGIRNRIQLFVIDPDPQNDADLFGSESLIHNKNGFATPFVPVSVDINIQFSMLSFQFYTAGTNKGTKSGEGFPSSIMNLFHQTLSKFPP